MPVLGAADEAMVDRFLDGELAGDDLLAFEARLGAEPALQAEVARLRGVGDLVRGVASSQEVLDLFADATEESYLTGAPILRKGRFLIPASLLAAAAALAVAVTLFGPIAPPQEAGRGSPIRLTLGSGAATVYNVSIADFEPYEVCRTSEEFAVYTDDVFGVPLAADFDAGVELIGWTIPFGRMAGAEAPGLSAPRVLLARAPGGEQVIAVFAERGTWSPGDAAGGLNVFAAEMGDVSVYEVSPLDTPVVLGLVSEAGGRRPAAK